MTFTNTLQLKQQVLFIEKSEPVQRKQFMKGKKSLFTLLFALSMFILGCTIYRKPSPEKLESFQPTTNYNYYTYYAVEFEGQIGDQRDDMIHFGLNHQDSTYWITISNGDSLQGSKDTFRGKYSVNQHGTVLLHGASPFKKNTYQIITPTRTTQAHFLAKFHLTVKYAQFYGKQEKRAYCEIDFPYELEECKEIISE